MAEKLIAAFCPMDFEDEIYDAAYGSQVALLDCDNLMEAADAALTMGAKMLVIMDGTSDEPDSVLLSAVRMVSGICEPVFVSTFDQRPWPSAFFNSLVEAGCKRIAVGGEGEADGWQTKLSAAISKPVKKKDFDAYCVSKASKAAETRKKEAKPQKAKEAPAKAEAEKAPEEEAPQTAMGDGAPRQNAAGEQAKPALQQPTAGRRAGKFVSVGQGISREGSTHVALAISRAIAIAYRGTGDKVACVLPERHFEQLEQAYARDARKDPSTGSMLISGVWFFAGTTPRCAGVDFETVVCDFGTMDWLQKPATMEAAVAAKDRRDLFYSCEVRVFASRMAPTGDWPALRHVLPLMSARELGTQIYATTGVADDGFEAMIKARLESNGQKPDNFVSVGYCPAPLTARDATEVDEGIKAIASKALQGNRKAVSQLYKGDAGLARKEAARRRQFKLFMAMMEAGQLDGEAVIAAEGMTDRQVDDRILEIRKGAAAAEEANALRDKAAADLVAEHLKGEGPDTDTAEGSRQVEIAKAMLDADLWFPHAIDDAAGATDADNEKLCEALRSGDVTYSQLCEAHEAGKPVHDLIEGEAGKPAEAEEAAKGQGFLKRIFGR